MRRSRSPAVFPLWTGGNWAIYCAGKSTPWISCSIACRRKFGMERVAVHPFLGPLRVDQWRRFHVVHGFHHLTQLRSVIAQVAPVQVPVTIAGPKLVEKLQVPAQRPLA